MSTIVRPISVTIHNDTKVAGLMNPRILQRPPQPLPEPEPPTPTPEPKTTTAWKKGKICISTMYNRGGSFKKT